MSQHGRLLADILEVLRVECDTLAAEINGFDWAAPGGDAELLEHQYRMGRLSGVSRALTLVTLVGVATESPESTNRQV